MGISLNHKMDVNHKHLAIVCDGNARLYRLMYKRSKALAIRASDLEYRLAEDDILVGIGYIQALLDASERPKDTRLLTIAHLEAKERLQDVRSTKRYASSLRQEKTSAKPL